MIIKYDSSYRVFAKHTFSETSELQLLRTPQLLTLDHPKVDKIKNLRHPKVLNSMRQASWCVLYSLTFSRQMYENIGCYGLWDCRADTWRRWSLKNALQTNIQHSSWAGCRREWCWKHEILRPSFHAEDTTVIQKQKFDDRNWQMVGKPGPVSSTENIWDFWED